MLASATAVGVVGFGRASAYTTTGCKFDPNGWGTSGGKVTSKYSSVTSAWVNAHDNSMSRWNVTTNGPDVINTTSIEANIWVYDDTYTGTWNGRASYYCSRAIFGAPTKCKSSTTWATRGRGRQP